MRTAMHTAMELTGGASRPAAARASMIITTIITTTPSRVGIG